MRHDERVDPIPTLTLRLKGRECWLTAVSALGVLAGPYDDARMMSAPFSAMAITVALILPDGTAGMIEASTTRRCSTPRTHNFGSTTARASIPMRQVEVGWNTVSPASRQYASNSSSL